MTPYLEVLERRDAPSSFAPPPTAVVTDYGSRLGAEWLDQDGRQWGAWQLASSPVWNGPGLTSAAGAPPPVLLDRLATQTLPPAAVVSQPDPAANYFLADLLAADGTHQQWWSTGEPWWSGPVAADGGAP